MGLAGGIVRKVFSKSPCSSSAGGSGRGHTSEKASADHRRRWSSIRLYLCGEEMMSAAADEDDEDGGETVSVKSFETCCVMPPPPEEAHAVVVVPVARRPTSDAHSAADRMQARRQLQELRATRQEHGTDGAAQEPTCGASVATSVLVQVGESLSNNLRLSGEDEESASVQQQQRSNQRPSSSRPPPSPSAAAFRVKEEWDDSTVSSNVSRMRIQSRIEATTRRERALAYAFSQQLRSCGGGGGGGKKRSSARAEQGEFNVGWSWLERWMATRQLAEPAADDCMSRNADTGSSATAGAGRRVVVVRRRNKDLAVGVEAEKESCGSNDVVSVVSFDGSSTSRGGAGARSRLGSHKPATGKSRLKGGGRSLPRRKQVAASDHRFQARSHKVSKKGHHRVEQAPHNDRLDAAAGFNFADACQPPTDY